MSVGIEREGPVTVVTSDRPEVRNAVDRRTAKALADVFRAFDADDAAFGMFCRRWGVPLVDGGTVRCRAWSDSREPSTRS